MQDDAIPARFAGRDDLLRAYAFGEVLAGDTIVDLFLDALHRYAGDPVPTADGVRAPTDRDRVMRIAAGLAGAAAAFAQASEQWWPPDPEPTGG